MKGIQLVPTVIPLKGCPAKPSDPHYLGLGGQAVSHLYIPFYRETYSYTFQ